MNKIKLAGLYLSLSGLLKDLVADGLLSQADANSLAAAQRGQDEALLHPLEIIAARQYSHPQTNSPLTLQALSQWLADKAQLQLAHIDPLRINVPAVTGAMSFAYALCALRSVPRSWS